MAGVNNMRLNKVLREFNISLDRAVDFLSSKGHEIEARPTTKISSEIYQLLTDEFQGDKSKKVASKEKGEEKRKEKEAIRVQIETEQEEKRQKAKSNEVVKAKAQLNGPKQVGKINLNKPKPEIKITGKAEIAKPKKKEEAPKAKTSAEEVKAKPAAPATPEKPAPIKEAEVGDAPSEKVATQYKKLNELYRSEN